MGVTLNQRMPAGTSLGRRVAVGTTITDEIFGITIARPGIPSPYYGFGAWTAAVPMWALGTTIGIITGTALPARIVSALSVAIFGMFLAVIIPPARKDRMIGIAVVISFVCSYAATNLPVFSQISSGNRTILLTLLLSSLFAFLAPRADADRSKQTDPASKDSAGEDAIL